MERSFKQEVEKLKLGEGETFHGEAILAVTKALLQSGVSYVGGYQGAPVSHVMDVLNDARDILDELGVHVETNANEAGAAAMLGASINYPMRGAVAFKSTVGTNVASDALSNLASAGVKGGTVLILGEDYGEGASIIQERTHAFAMKFIREHALNEVFAGDMTDIGIVCQGGMYNAVIRALQTLGLADAFGNARVPIYCLNVTYPLVPDEIVSFCADKREVLIVEEGQPAYIEDAILAALRRADVNAVRVRGKDVLPLAGEYTGEVVLTGISKFLGREQAVAPMRSLKEKAAQLLSGLPQRPPGFCVGCPERPVFSAMKLIEKETGKYHVSADIGCHLFSTLPPFNIGNTVLGYGLGLASNSAVNPAMAKRTVTIMGDGGFWHNGLTTGVANHVFNKNDGILVIMKNGYSSATGTQELPSSPQHSEVKEDISMERALEGVGVGWVKTVDNYRVGEVAKTLKEAMTTDYKGLKVIVAEGECQLERQRKLRPQVAEKLKKGARHVRVKYGEDEDTCTGDHSCIRLSGCPTLTIKDNPDPLRTDPVATVIDGCVGCGLCGENAHAAVLCPSFYRAEVIQNPTWWDKLLNKIRGTTVH